MKESRNARLWEAYAIQRENNGTICFFRALIQRKQDGWKLEIPWAWVLRKQDFLRWSQVEALINNSEVYLCGK